MGGGVILIGLRSSFIRVCPSLLSVDEKEISRAAAIANELGYYNEVFILQVTTRPDWPRLRASDTFVAMTRVREKERELRDVFGERNSMDKPLTWLLENVRISRSGGYPAGCERGSQSLMLCVSI